MIDPRKETAKAVIGLVIMWIIFIALSLSHCGCNRTLTVDPTAPVPTPTVCRGC